MGIRAPLIVSLVIVAGMVLLSAWAWPLVPDVPPVAIHWDLGGRANGFASKPFALLIMPALALGCTLAFALLPLWRGPQGLDTSRNAYLTGWLGTLVVLADAHAVLVAVARGWQANVSNVMLFAVALLITLIGNFLGKTEPNTIVGVRTPWTRASDLSWEKSNRAAGRMLVGVGLITLGAGVVMAPAAAFKVLLAGVLVAAAASVALSRYYWKHDPDRRP